MAAPRALVLGLCALLLAIAVANAEAASVVVGLAKCADCTRKNMKAEEAFKGLQVAIKCKNVHGEYESKAVGGLDGTGAFSVPLAADLHGADCVAQLHKAASNAPCPGQEPSKVVPVSEGTTYGVVAGAKTTAASAECASVTLCGPIKKHFLEHFHHKKPVPPKPEPMPQPHPDYHPIPPKPEPKPQPHPDYHPVPPTPTYGGGGGHPSAPIYHAESKTMLGPIKKHIIDHFHHKKPVPPKPEPKPQPHPDYHPVPPTPTYGGGGGHPSAPVYHAEPSQTMLGPIKKHILDHFHHKKPVPPKPEPKPQPHPDYHPVPPTPTYGGEGGHPSDPIYRAEPSKTMLGPIKKHILDHFHHKKPVPPKPEPKPQPHPDYHPVPPTPTYGGGGGHPSTPIYHAESKTMLGPIKKHILDHFHHKKPVPPKPEPKPQPHPDYHPVPPTPTYGGGGGHPSAPIYHAEPSKTMLGPIKKHILDDFHHKKPVPPKPEPKPQPHPDYHPVPPTPTYGGGGGHPSTPIYHAESKTMLGPIKQHILDHFHHKKPVPPKPEPKPQPHPDYHPVPPTPTYGGGGGHPSAPIYHAESSKTMLGPIKKHILDHFHHKKPVPPKPEPKPQPHPDYHPVPPTPTYGGGGGHPSTPIYHAESKTMLGPIKKHILEHFHHKKPVPPKPEPKPQPHPDYHPVPPTPTYGSGGGHPSTPIYHPPSQH